MYLRYNTYRTAVGVFQRIFSVPTPLGISVKILQRRLRTKSIPSRTYTIAVGKALNGGLLLFTPTNFFLFNKSAVVIIFFFVGGSPNQVGVHLCILISPSVGGNVFAV